MKSILKFLLKLNLSTKLEDLYCRIPYYGGRGKAFNPLSVVLLASYRCNLRCKMCFYYNEEEADNTYDLIEERQEDELSKPQILKLIDDSAEMNVKVFTIHGGEPLLYPDFFDIAEYAYHKGMLVNIVSNGTLITKETAKKIVETKINHITFSLDGPETIHDEVRNVKGTFKKLISGIENLKELENNGHTIPRLSIGTYISALNQHNITEIIDVIKKLDIQDWGVGLITYNNEKLTESTKKMLGFIDKSHQGSIENIPDEVKNIDISNLKKQRQLVKEKNTIYGINIIFPSEKAIDNYYNNVYNERNYCLIPWARTVISPYGEVFPCINFSLIGYNLGNIKEKSLKDIWNSLPYKDFRRMLKKRGLFPLCSKCCMINNIRKL
ncbi:radical SAM/SPASM domain-containing protein [Candidatus Latescibacterota bacterium]